MQELYERFPEMKPIGSAPALSTINGIGMMLYGKRDFDAETRTYVKTLWFTIAFIPIFSAGAYRVADAPNGGWFFLGRVPVSGIARSWPLILIALAGIGLGFSMWHRHTSSPEYQAQKKMEQADRLRQKGELTEAAHLYQEVARGRTEYARKAVEAVTEMVKDVDLQQQSDAKEMVGVFRAAWELRSLPGGAKDLFLHGFSFADRRTGDAPEESLAVLETVEPAAPNPDGALAPMKKLLEKLVADRPGNVEFLSKLAVLYERGNERDRLEPLLRPHEKKLGASEAARILGQICARQGKFEEAYALLQPYADSRLDRLHKVEKEYEDAQNQAIKRVVAHVNTGNAHDFPYQRYDKVGDAEKQALQQEYLAKQLRKDPDLKRQQEALMQEMPVVTVAIDLGMILLRRAQQTQDAAARKAELERAEKTFLAVQGLARGDRNYSLSLGEVYYWLSKQAEGQKLFDQVLNEEGRKFDTMLLVANLLRNLGEVTQTRALLEEAYAQKGIDTRQRQRAAHLRAITQKDLDDQVLWLQRSDPAEPAVKADLASSRGQQALRDGKDEQAAVHFREAVDIYAAMPEDPATLNNGALVCHELYGVTGDREVQQRAVKMIERAVTLKPRDSILLGNAASAVKAAALAEVIGDKINLGKLKREAGLELFAYLHQDAAGQQEQVKRVAQNPDIARARSYLDRAIVLSPKTPRLYALSQSLLSFLKDADGLRLLARRAEESRPDITELVQKAKELRAGKDEDKRRKEYEASAARADRLVSETRAGGGATFAVAAGQLISLRLYQDSLDVPVDLDAVVKLAEEAHQTAPSAATDANLLGALIGRATRALIKTEPGYADVVKRCRRSLGQTYVLAAVLWRDGKPRQAALANEDVKRVIDMVRASATRFPDEGGAWTWAMLQASHPEDAARVMAATRKDELLPSQRALEKHLSPLDGVKVLRECWELDSAGKSKEVLEVLKRGKAEGLTLPFDP